MHEQAYLTYIELKDQIADLEDQLAEQAEIIKEDIAGHDDDAVQTQYGIFYVTKRKKWKYSEAVDQVNEQLKFLKKLEEDSEVAKLVETTRSLTFRPIKAEEQE